MSKLLFQLRRLLFGNKTKDGHFFGTYDVPDKRDLKVPLLPEVKFPEYFSLVDKSKTTAYDQEQTGSCTAQASTQAKQVMDRILDNSKVVFDPLIQWALQKSRGASDTGGDKLQNALHAMKDQSPVDIKTNKEYPLDRYRLVKKDSFEVMKWILRGRPIFTGVYVRKVGSADNFAWAKFRGGVVDLENGYILGGHAIILTGFVKKNGKYYIEGYNSWGEDYGYFSNGKFLIAEDQIGRIMSPYVLIDYADV